MRRRDVASACGRRLRASELSGGGSRRRDEVAAGERERRRAGRRPAPSSDFERRRAQRRGARLCGRAGRLRSRSRGRGPCRVRTDPGSEPRPSRRESSRRPRLRGATQRTGLFADGTRPYRRPTGAHLQSPYRRCPTVPAFTSVPQLVCFCLCKKLLVVAKPVNRTGWGNRRPRRDGRRFVVTRVYPIERITYLLTWLRDRSVAFRLPDRSCAASLPLWESPPKRPGLDLRSGAHAFSAPSWRLAASASAFWPFRSSCPIAWMPTPGRHPQSGRVWSWVAACLVAFRFTACAFDEASLDWRTEPSSPGLRTRVGALRVADL